MSRLSLITNNNLITAGILIPSLYVKGEKANPANGVARCRGGARGHDRALSRRSVGSKSTLAGRGGSAGPHSIAWVMIGTPVAGGQPVRLL